MKARRGPLGPGDIPDEYGDQSSGYGRQLHYEWLSQLRALLAQHGVQSFEVELDRVVAAGMYTGSGQQSTFTVAGKRCVARVLNALISEAHNAAGGD